MEPTETAEIARDLFAAFGRGDIPHVLSLMTEDVEWIVPGPSAIPFAGVRRGRDEVPGFFAAIGPAVDFEQFEIFDYLAQGDRVVIPGHERGRVKATGKAFEHDWVVILTFRDGKVAKFQAFDDTAAILAAFTH